MKDGIIFVAGIYGVGKSTLCERLSISIGIPCYSAGDLISAINGEIYGRNKTVAAMGMALSWERLDNKKSSLICTYIKGLDFKNHENYPELMNKSIDLVVKMRDVLKEYVLAEL